MKRCNNAEELRALFIKKGWRDPRFEVVSADDLKSIFGFANNFITGPVYRMLGTGQTGRGNIFDSYGKIVFYDIPVKKED